MSAAEWVMAIQVVVGLFTVAAFAYDGSYKLMAIWIGYSWSNYFWFLLAGNNK